MCERGKEGIYDDVRAATGGSPAGECKGKVRVNIYCRAKWGHLLSPRARERPGLIYSARSRGVTCYCDQRLHPFTHITIISSL